MGSKFSSIISLLLNVFLFLYVHEINNIPFSLPQLAIYSIILYIGCDDIIIITLFRVISIFFNYFVHIYFFSLRRMIAIDFSNGRPVGQGWSILSFVISFLGALGGILVALSGEHMFF